MGVSPEALAIIIQKYPPRFIRAARKMGISPDELAEQRKRDHDAKVAKLEAQAQLIGIPVPEYTALTRRERGALRHRYLSRQP
jgi:hypothetical protein